MKVFEELFKLNREGRLSVLATIVQCSGSAPQKEGARMLVRDDHSITGTLGGGCIEEEVIQEAMMVMTDRTPRTVHFNLNESSGSLVCGGKILVFIEPFIPAPRVVILGAGHVGKALSTIARFSGFNVTVVDDRAEHANQGNIPDAHVLIINDFDSVFDIMPVGPGVFIVIATRGHSHDLNAAVAALKTNAGYIGLLGSRRKKAVLFKALKERGFDDVALGRINIPAGLLIGSVTPEEIAVSIMAQVIQHRRAHVSSYIGSGPCSRTVPQNGGIKATPAAFGEATNQALP